MNDMIAEHLIEIATKLKNNTNFINFESEQKQLADDLRELADLIYVNK